MSLSARHLASTRGDAPALVFDSATLSWAEVAAALPPVDGEGPVFSLSARRDPESILSILAAIEAQIPLAPMHPRATAAEVAAMHTLVAELGSATDRRAAPDDRPLAYLFTSGSTAAPRAAALSRRAFVAAARASAANLAYGPGDRWLLAMPLAHVGGLSVLTRTLLAGATAVVAPEGSMSAPQWVARMADARVTHVSLVPAMLARIVAEGLSAPGTIRAVLLGGAPAAGALVRDARGLGWPVLPTYGSTEACSQVATRAPDDRVDADGRIGRPLPGVRVRIVDGEIWVGGPTLFDGYVGAGSGLGPAPVDADGCFATGDLGHLDAEGVLWVHGRRSDVIISGGENVHPAAVEAVLLSHPEIVEACVYGVPDPGWGEAVEAVYRSASGPVAGLEAWLRERLAPHRRPKRLIDYRPVGELPKTKTGKVDRGELRRRALGPAADATVTSGDGDADAGEGR